MDIPKVVRTVIERLQHAGFEAYIVGGAVRDTCLRRPLTDWDIATSAAPEEIREIFCNERHFSLKHDTVTLVDSGKLYEVTTFRGGKGRGRSIMEDLGHRDLTINAMAYDLSQGIILDPFGGQKDLSAKRVRAVGKAEERFSEDPLRLLRAVRVAHEFGFRIERKTLRAVTRMAGQLATVASERIREELMKILITERPSSAFYMMRRTGLLKVFLPELLEGYLKKQNAHHRFTLFRHVMETLDRINPDPVLRLTALLHDIAKPRVRKRVDGVFRFYGHEKASASLAEEIMIRLRFSSEMIGLVTHLIAHHRVGYDRAWGDGAVRRFIRRVGPGNMDRLLKFRRADLWAHGIIDDKLGLLSELEGRIEQVSRDVIPLRPTDLAIDGRRVMEILGLEQGPAVGRILDELMDKVIDRPEINTEEALTSLVKLFDKIGH